MQHDEDKKTMTDFYAHSLEKKPPSEWQPLREHLMAVACRACKFAREAMPDDKQFADAAKWAGLLHDLGKYTSEFQSYLRKERSSGIETRHAVFGARCAFDHSWLGPTFASAGHHAGLYDLGELQSLVKNTSYGLDSRLPTVLKAFSVEMDNPIFQLSEPRFAENKLSAEFYIRMLFSCLVDADFLDTEKFCSDIHREPIQFSAVSDLLLNRLLREVRSKPQQGEVNSVRRKIFNRCLSVSQENAGFFSLTVPTGGGKTLSGMAFALSHAIKNNLRRVIVVIPYLSIIEQNAAEYRRILDPNNEGLVIEHHSSVPVSQNYDEQARSQAELAAENWDAPIVVTTSVQFIESLFANTNSRCRKLHNIARSVVIFDEVQTIPTHLLSPLFSVIREMKENYGVPFVFSSATQPAFRYSASLVDGFKDGEVIEIAGKDSKQVSAHFSALRRVCFKRERSLGMREIAARIALNNRVLCVVNVRKHAFDLWEAVRSAVGLEKDSVFHLSSAMCAEHRLDILGNINDPGLGTIRHRLKNGLPCRLISTQLVEAGVDLDFPIVFRALAPLDSIVQAAGRCNREGVLKDSDGQLCCGTVVVFALEESSLPSGIYRTATGYTETFLGHISLDEIIVEPDKFAGYFSGLFALAPTDHERKREATIQEDRANLYFREVAGKAKVIADAGTPVIVQYGHGKCLIEKIRLRDRKSGTSRFSRTDLRMLQRFMVNIRERDFYLLQNAGQISNLLHGLEIFVLNEASYHKHLGVLVDRRPMEDFIGV